MRTLVVLVLELVVAAGVFLAGLTVMDGVDPVADVTVTTSTCWTAEDDRFDNCAPLDASQVRDLR